MENKIILNLVIIMVVLGGFTALAIIAAQQPFEPNLPNGPNMPINPDMNEPNMPDPNMPFEPNLPPISPNTPANE